MKAKVELRITEGKEKGKVFAFDQHDTFVFGRMEDCHARIPDDQMVSRHHFILEVNPPQACLRDLGSLNGTWINDKKCGSREKGETPEQGARRKYPEISIKHGDQIKVGETVMAVSIQQAAEPARHRADPDLADLSELSPEKLIHLLFGTDRPAQKPRLTIPGHLIERELGRGGFGAVYLAKRIADGEKVAIKVMLSRIDANDSAIEQFQREVAVTAGLQHPNIVRLLDHGSDGSVFYFVMELCDSGSAGDRLAKHPRGLPLADVAPIALDALRGLAHAHGKGIVHRDIKPQNILLHQGRARLSDFGLSKSFQRAGLSGLSLTGSYAGTPYFMPREQITNFKYVKPVTDIWSFAATIYNLLTGEFPYQFPRGRDPIDVILNDEVQPIRKRLPTLPKDLATLIDKAVAKNAKARFQDGAKLLAEMGPVLEAVARKAGGR